jgi:ADP-L-glycero-D-manno-heptose 6-epimerase
MFIVTGGAGFVGSNLVKGLNGQGVDNILVVDNMGSGDKFRNLIPLNFRDYMDKKDFMDNITAGRFEPETIEAVFHIGACSDTMEYNGNYMMQNNYEYSKELLHFCLRRKIPFIYASSASVYGGGKEGFAEREQCEDALNVYAFSKLQFDRYVRRLLPKTDSQVVGLRYFNVFGPQEMHKGKMASIAYQLYKQVNQAGGARLFAGTEGYGNGEQLRDFIYVKDVVKVNLYCWLHPKTSGIFNCGTGKARSFNDVANSIIKAKGKGRIEYIPFPESLKGKYQSFTEADTAQLLAAGYDGGFTALEAAIADYCRHLDENNGYLGV